MTAGPAPHSRGLRFGPFLLDLRRRMLLEDGRPVRLGSRAIDLLEALTVKPGELMTRNELTSQVWPTTVVEETSLRVHIYALRKALGDTSKLTRYIANVPGRGYSFIAPVEACEIDGSAVADAGQGAQPALVASRRGNLPFHTDAMIGRDDLIRDVLQALDKAPLVSIVGAGGMGKTRVAVAAGHALAEQFKDGAWFVDLSPVAEPSVLTAHVAMALRAFVHGDNPWPRLEAHLQGRRLLILLDNCEHLLADVAALASALISAAGDVRVIATSRVPLGIAGEAVVPLPPLESREAFQLFVDRARSSSGDMTLEVESDAKIRAICDRLDGMPLAIELAAVRAVTLGLDRLLGGLDDVIELLARGRRASSPRHRTLVALLDWSYELLPVDEQTVLCRLSVFRGGFSCAAAIDIAACQRIPDSAVRRCIEALVTKSLIARASNGVVETLRLLHITRAYAQDRLLSSGHAAEFQRRHAHHVRRHLLVACEALRELEEQDLSAWHQREAMVLDDVRAAIDRSFAAGDGLSGILVCAAARHHALEFGLFAEFAPRIQQACRLLRELALDESTLELNLLSVWCQVGILVGHDVADKAAFADRMLDLMARVPDRDDKIEALYGLIAWASTAGEHMQTLAYVGRLRQLVPEDGHPAWVMLGERMLATTHHQLGDHDAALALMQKVYSYPTRKVHRGYVGQAPGRVTASVYLMRILWIQGRSDDASALLEEVLRHSYPSHPMAMPWLIGQGGLPLLIWQGRDEMARELLNQLKEQVNQHELGFWRPFVESYEYVLARRDKSAGQIPRAAPAGHLMATDLFSTFAPDLVSSQTLARAESGAVGWCAPEILRADAENRLRRDPNDASAEASLERALSLARCQSALAWELRIACSLAQLWVRRNDHARAQRLLAPTLARMRQGLETADVCQARSLLMRIGQLTGGTARA